MALKQCDECGSWVSDKDKACPNCGYPMTNSKRFALGKRSLYAILGLVFLSALVALAVYLHQDLAKREAVAKAEVENMRKELQEQRTRDSLALVRIEEERRLAEQKAAEEAAIEQEEQERIAEGNRMNQPVEKMVRLECNVSDRMRYSHSGNYGSKVYTERTSSVILSMPHMLRIPSGKVWVYKGYNRSGNAESHHPILYYYSRENEGYSYGNGKKRYMHDQKIDLRQGGVPTLRSGDGFNIEQEFEASKPSEGFLNVYFVEKNEDYYY